MEMIKVVVLVCATSTPRAECQPDTALDIIKAPDASTMGLCSLQAQAFLAQTAVARDLASDNYLKIQCTRRHVPEATATHCPGPPESKR